MYIEMVVQIDGGVSYSTFSQKFGLLPRLPHKSPMYECMMYYNILRTCSISYE